jgi:hypothetical protein
MTSPALAIIGTGRPAGGPVRSSHSERAP